MTGDVRSKMWTLTDVKNTDDELSSATNYVLSHARDVPDAKLILSMLGLI
jgi:hypothetical protein